MKLQFKSIVLDIPFSKPTHIFDRLHKTRQVLFVQLEAAGIETLAEVAPLPGYHQDNAKECEAYLNQHLVQLALGLTETSISGLLKQFQVYFTQHPCPYALRLPLEIAILQLRKGQLKEQEDEWFTQGETDSYFCNAGLFTLGSSFEATVEEAISKNFNTLKIKIGRGKFKEEVSQIEALVKAHPDIYLRLDANQKLSKEAFNLWKRASRDWPVEYFEEPILFTADNLQEMKDVDIALDESLLEFKTLQERAKWPARHWVLKPNFWPSLEQLFLLAKLAHQYDVSVVYSSPYETPVGLTQHLLFFKHLFQKQFNAVVGVDTLKALNYQAYFKTDCSFLEKSIFQLSSSEPLLLKTDQ